MGLVKFEVDIPNFEKELSINITIRRDGEVLYTSTSSPSTCCDLNSSSTNTQPSSFPCVSDNSSVSSLSVVDDTVKSSELDNSHTETKKVRKKVEKEKTDSTPTLSGGKRSGNFMGVDF